MLTDVVVVGVGALGSHVVLFGRNWRDPMVLVDFDRVERKNTLAQFHPIMGEGKNKTIALSTAMNGLFRAKMATSTYKVSKDNVAAILGNAKLVLDCTDNAEARRVIQGWVRAAGIPCLHGALSADGSFGRIVWDEHFVADEEGVAGQATCEDGLALPFFALAAAQMAATAQVFLTKGVKRSFQLTESGIIRLA